ncbi:uncharacterized protein B0H64DRAFT_144204 [Chaetomium fimeti]|uniref:F-box domain-containing protein n=1 Tax=Chaetomium fimeti TaxID=1854472 RepID=A0AAE0HEY3_9PEZI|nr:hypothetical protein B0H64DRAFT_144204 [Chaetomium fimeti]
MPTLTITELPCEVMAAILRNLDNLRSLTPALLTCRHFYTSFKQYHGIEPAIVRNQVTPALLPYSVALLDASNWPRSLAGGLLDTLYNEPAQLSARVSSMPVSTLQQMARSHELIRKLSTLFATEAWGHLSPGNRDDDSISLSPTEDSRFCRTFYRLELFYRLFRTESGVLDPDFEERTKSWFFSRHPPWENEQIGCAHEFLEAKLRQASRDVVAHDIFFGEIDIDYVSTGRDNNWNQLWVSALVHIPYNTAIVLPDADRCLAGTKPQLSQGLEFIDKLMNADSYEAKRSLLSSTFAKASASFPLAADWLTETDGDWDESVGDYDQEELLPAASAWVGSNLDRGPYEAWRAAHLGMPPVVSVMLDNNAWLRERAYVLWDWGRMQRIDLLAVIKAGPSKDPSSSWDGEEYDMMLKSFEERSKLWRQGMTGYWNGGEDAAKEGKPDE